jgi:hypothetical protein
LIANEAANKEEKVLTIIQHTVCGLNAGITVMVSRFTIEVTRLKYEKYRLLWAALSKYLPLFATFGINRKFGKLWADPSNNNLPKNGDNFKRKNCEDGSKEKE